MMKQQEKNYYIQQKLPKVSMQLLEKKETNLMKKRLRTMMNMKMYRKYNETVLTVNSDVLIFYCHRISFAHCARVGLL